jgi:iron complex outermembrane receptor protein
MFRFMLSWACLALPVFVHAQHEIKGLVINDLNQPLPGAVIRVADSWLVASSADDGRFFLSVKAAGDYMLLISYVGYETAEVALSVPSLEETIIQLRPSMVQTGVALVSAVRSREFEPVSGSILEKEDIAPLNNGQDLPFLLRFTPSLVVTSDAGNGIGYTGLRIRGTDASRINVTINGVPLNDPESQAVFWVNLPDLASSVSSIQVQRGVGTSTNGAGAFGGSINISTEVATAQAYGTISNSLGSFATRKHNVQFGSGIISNYWALEGRLSQISSDGYIDRATADLTSYYLSGGYYGNRSSLTALIFGGAERTYQSWYGTPQSRLENDEEAMLLHATNNSFTEAQTDNLLNSGRTYNYYLYENEVDNYNQDHYQLHFRHKVNNKLSCNLSAHYTWGRGYFEQFREDDPLTDYGLNPLLIQSGLVYSNALDTEGNPVNTSWGEDLIHPDIDISQIPQLDMLGDTITDVEGNVLLAATAAINSTDVVRRRWLDNDFYGITWSAEYQSGRLRALVGGAANRYDGDHFGELLWMQHAAGSAPGDYFYLNFSRKDDANTFVKVDYRLSDKLNVFTDLQGRFVDYSAEGLDIGSRPIAIDTVWMFFNPKAGITWQANRGSELYASWSVANREPSRNDFIDAVPGSPAVKHETLNDIEIGFRKRLENIYAEISTYYMMYNNQLVLTGELNDVGNPIRRNVKRSYRRGIECQVAYSILNNLSINLNATISENKIDNFTEVLYDYSSDEGGIVFKEYERTDIAFSPSVISAGVLTWTPMRKSNHRIDISAMANYVGEQFLDNTSDKDSKLQAYVVPDLIFAYGLSSGRLRQLNFRIYIQNIADAKYNSNGWTYSYLFGERQRENFYFPQAGRNYMISLEMKI